MVYTVKSWRDGIPQPDKDFDDVDQALHSAAIVAMSLADVASYLSTVAVFDNTSQEVISTIVLHPRS